MAEASRAVSTARAKPTAEASARPAVKGRPSAPVGSLRAAARPPRATTTTPIITTAIASHWLHVGTSPRASEASTTNNGLLAAMGATTEMGPRLMAV